METNILKRIFFDEHGHWDSFVMKYKKRSNVLKEVEKFRGCGDLSKGFKLLVCEGCHDLRLVPYRCKGRFCTTSSCGETEEWARILELDVFQVNYRHVVFTIDEGLWEIFLLHREKLLKDFMDEAVRVVKAYFEKKHRAEGNVKQQLGYIGRYMRRPAIDVSRIEAYDGEMVTFRYRDKTDGEEKMETIFVEEFIGRLIRHIPDENFKTIRYYGVYSRRIKSLCKKLVSEWQKAARRWDRQGGTVIETKNMG